MSTPAPTDRPRGAPPSTLRVASYNIHSCIGRDGVRAPQRIGQILADIDADVVALQEVNTALDTTRKLGQLEVIAGWGGYTPLTCPSIPREGGFYGNALLVRGEVVEVERHDISAGFEPRTTLEALVDTSAGRLRAFTAHFGLNRDERRAQADRLLAVVERERHGDPTVVMGDFNEWFGYSRNLRRLERALGDRRRLRTFPAHRPLFALDRIWAIPPRALDELWVVRDALTRVASDHLPIVGRLRLD